MDLRDPQHKKLTQAEFDRLPDQTYVMAQVGGDLAAVRMVVRVRLDIAQGGDGGRVLAIPRDHQMAACFTNAWEHYPPDRIGDGEGEGEFLVVVIGEE